MSDKINRPNASGHLFVGLVFITVGVLFLLTRLNIFYGVRLLSQGWPLILVAVGILKLRSDTSTGRASGIFWIMLGALFFASQNGYLPFNVWSVLWPAALIWFGAYMVWRSRHSESVSSDSTSTVGMMAFMGGVRRSYNSPDFQGGEVTSIMGGCRIDLREAGISGEQVVLHVMIMMGGLELILPEGWTVVSKVVPIMGGFEDHSRPAKEPTKRLVIEGILMMGGIEVKN